MRIISTALLILLCGFATSGQTQKSVDSTVMNFLRTTDSFTTPVLRTIKKNNRTIRESNFFVKPCDSVFCGSVKIATFIFGFAASHEKRYFLLHVTLRSGFEEKIIDDPTVEGGVQSLLTFFKNFALTNEQKSIIIRALTYTYN